MSQSASSTAPEPGHPAKVRWRGRPTEVSRDAVHRPSPNGPAAAALIAAGLGLMALALAHVASEASGSWKSAMQALGNSWIPGAKGIGPYSGKETVGLLAWLVGWAVLHLVLRRRDVSLVLAGIVSLLLVGLSTTLLWPPVTHLFVH